MKKKEELMIDAPFSLKDTVKYLCEATNILLHEKNYDAHGYEILEAALKAGKEWLNNQE